MGEAKVPKSEFDKIECKKGSKPAEVKGSKMAEGATFKSEWGTK